MVTQLLHVLMVFAILYEPCFGMVCYICQSNTVDHDRTERYTVPPNVVQTVPFDANATIITTTSGPPTSSGPPVYEKGQPRITLPLAHCLDPKGKSANSKWLEDECGSKYRDCYKLEGEVFEKDVSQGGIVKTLERGCWHPNDGNWKLKDGEVGKCVELKTMGSVNGKNITAVATLCVCNSINSKGEMLCNHGTTVVSSIFNIFVVLLLVFAIMNLTP